MLNTGLAESIARKYAGRSEDVADLTQVAYLGLVNAVRRYTPERGVDFVSFAMPTIAGEVKRYFRDHGWTIRPPRRIQELHRQITTTAAGLAQRLGRLPTPGEIAAELDLDVRDVEEAQACHSCYTPMSLDAPVHTEDGGSLSDVIGADDAGFGRAEARTVLRPLCRALSPRDQRVLYLRFVRGWTQQEIADDMGITQMQVSRLLARILGHLRRRLNTRPVSRQAGSGSRSAVPLPRAA